ncbi:Wzz/FepE/Etk N-terminal domain-containing protein [Spiribacter onubensis]|uniref:Wzz/FepE/Etk N-terminal domain-containing protein n=1 Tax=Spiribacter onubensis TaxID=3122420 RepID=A0ABV3SB86_9GAMM
MTDDLKSPGEHRPAGRRGTSSEFAWPSGASTDDEISLYDLWATLVRRRLTILIVLIGVVLAAIGYGVLKKPVYDFQTALELGSYITESNERQYIETSESFLARLQDFYVPNARRALAVEQEGVPSAEARATDSPELFYITSQAILSAAGEVRRLHDLVAEEVVGNHSDRLGTVIDDREVALKKARSELEYLESGSVARERTREAREALNQATQTVEQLNDERRSERSDLVERLRSARSKRNTLSAEARLIETKIDTVERRQSQLQTEIERLQPLSSQLSNEPADSAASREDLAEVLIATTQSLEIVRRLGDLERQLQVELPQRRDELDARLQTVRMTIEDQGLEIAQLETRLDELDREYSRKIAAAEARLALADDQLAARQADYEREVELASEAVLDAERWLENFQPTRALFISQQSTSPVGVSSRQIVAIGAALGLILGVFAAFFREFLINAHAWQERESGT